MSACQEGILPKSIIWRRKVGFGSPLRAWLREDLAPLVSDLLSEQTLQSRGLVEATVVSDLRAQHDAGQADNAFRLYTLLALELWCRMSLDRTWNSEPEPSVVRLPAAPASESRPEMP